MNLAHHTWLSFFVGLKEKTGEILKMIEHHLSVNITRGNFKIKGLRIVGRGLLPNYISDILSQM